ncbi:MAG: squalene synthase HpnC [Gammaproteobacteria bacterium]|nr:squalene synthase HpnC [Gammaproteobacteria bacterium]
MGRQANITDLSAHDVDAAYAWCEDLARRHYENFPVASRLLPARLRRPIAAVYAFARLADDMADEGGLPEAARLAALDDWAHQLDAALAGRAGHPVFVALADLVARYRVPSVLFHDLLSAFRQDVTTRRYACFEDVLDYCRRSADPVGRILLHLAGEATPENLRLSDRVCSALQLINFWQDLAQDMDENDRIYLPEDAMAAHGVTVQQLRERRSDGAMRALMTSEYARTRTMMEEGAALGARLRGRFGLEIRLIVQGGLRVLDRLEAQQDVFSRPRLRRRDALVILWRALRRTPL